MAQANHTNNNNNNPTEVSNYRNRYFQLYFIFFEFHCEFRLHEMSTDKSISALCTLTAEHVLTMRLCFSFFGLFQFSFRFFHVN